MFRQPGRHLVAPETRQRITERTGVTEISDPNGWPINDVDSHGASLHARRLLGWASASLEILHCALVLLGTRACIERAEIAPPAGLGIRLARVQPILSGTQFPDHAAECITRKPWAQPADAGHPCGIVTLPALRRTQREAPHLLPAPAGILDQCHFAAVRDDTTTRGQCDAQLDFDLAE